MSNAVKPPSIFPENYNHKAGSALFGIDSKYLAQVQMKEIFYLIKECGFSYESLQAMPLELRRYYFHLMLEDREKQEEKLP